MNFRRKHEKKECKYKALYKGLYSGNIEEIPVVEPMEALAGFLQEGKDIWEVYTLISVIPLDKTE